MDKHHDRFAISGPGGVRPDIQRQAVLALQIVGTDFGRPLTLNGTLAKVLSLVNTLTVFRRNRTFPAQVTDWRNGIGNSLEGKNISVRFADKSSVMADYGKCLVIGACNLLIDADLPSSDLPMSRRRGKGKGR